MNISVDKCKVIIFIAVIAVTFGQNKYDIHVYKPHEKLLAVSLRWWRFSPKTVVAPRLRCDGGIRKTTGDVTTVMAVLTTHRSGTAPQVCRGYNKLKHNACAGFWKEVNTHNCKKKAPLSNNIDVCFGPSDIIEMWWGHFQDIFNDVSNLQINNMSRTDSIASVLIISQLLVASKRP